MNLRLSVIYFTIYGLRERSNETDKLKKFEKIVEMDGRTGLQYLPAEIFC